jgi:mono/diheme cytochrome c family protein/glucose/arabinose dehydrogenase
MKKILYSFLLVLMAGVFFYCQSNKPIGTPAAAAAEAGETQEPEEAPVDLNASPVVGPAAAIRKMEVEPGFEVKLVAAEPLVTTPVALSFDARGRMWVVEMEGYMPDTVGTGEDIPNGKVVILEDTNQDGVADSRKVFLDSLVLPRAICLIENGILVAEPTNLWFYEIKDDKAGKKVLVDPQYTEGGNVEHQPNGLLRAMDNWIYNAKSTKRYRKQGDKWLIERTHFRGQWGITQDNYGRLYYNDNSSNLHGDFYSPGLGATNKNQRGVGGYNEKVVADNRVYPARPTPGVNRGYMTGVLDDSLRLRNFTAACGPVIYRGDLFGPDYAGNAFVAEPSANLIKRNVLQENGYLTKGAQAYKGHEFVASTDERFRPVTLTNAPDGSLFVVDMYRGIIQHKTYLTTYLKKEIGKRELTQPLACGRIYKIVPKGKASRWVTLPGDPGQLVGFLGHPNGWVRDKAQQLLVDSKSEQVVPALRQALQDTGNPLRVMHALWTLEGLGQLQTEEVLALLQQPVWPVRMQALSVVPSLLSKTTYKEYLPALEQLVSRQDSLAAPYVAFLSYHIRPLDRVAANRLLKQVAQAYPNNRYVADAVASALQDREESFKKELAASLPDTKLAIHQSLQRVITSRQNARFSRDPKALAKAFPKGAAMFAASCQTCHGADGNGVAGLAPPLNRSQWVTGDKDNLIAIVLFGLTGPVQVNGHVYKAPEINGDMPGIGYNKDLKSEDVAQLLSFIRKSWRNEADAVTTAEVNQIRQKLKGRQKAFTVEELSKM